MKILINKNILTPLEREKFTRALKLNRSDHWLLCIELLLRTGMRSDELTRFDSTKHVNRAAGTLDVVASKGSLNRSIPLDVDILDALLHQVPGPLLEVLKLSEDSFKRQLARRFDRFKLDVLGYNYGHVTLHGLRATFAQAVYSSLDGDIRTVSRLLGHKSILNTLKYCEDLNLESDFNRIRKAI